MILLFFCFVVLLLSATADSLPHIFNVAEENGLDQFLLNCSYHPLQQDTSVVLSTNVTHYISNEASFIVINTTYSLTLRSSASSDQATIQCNDSNGQPQTGFIFVNIHQLTLQRLVFKRCGAFLRNSSVIDVINSTESPVYFSQNHSAVLLFLYNKRLVIQRVNVTSYYGFAILAVNPMNASMDSLVVSSSSGSFPASGISIGSGVLLYFTSNVTTDTTEASVLHNVTISNALFQFNIEYIDAIGCLTHLQHFSGKRLPVINAAGLTVLYTQHGFEPTVSILGSNLLKNIGTPSGAMLVFYYGTNSGRTIVDLTRFGHYNEILIKGPEAFGASLALVMMHSSSFSAPLIVQNSTFKGVKEPSSLNSNGAVFVGVYKPMHGSKVVVALRNVSFHYHDIPSTGACLYARVYFYGSSLFEVLSIVLENITAYKNSQTGVFNVNSRAGMFALFNAGELNVSGVNNFRDNYGSVFEVTNTRINLLKGILHFKNNQGDKGPAFKLHDNSHFHFGNGLNATFIDNTALTKGGAIYAYDELSGQCMFKTLSSNYRNVNLTFINNTASESGSSIFSNNLYKCYTGGEIRSNSISFSLYGDIFDFPYNSSLNHMSTPANTVANLIYGEPVYPGQTITLYLSARCKSDPGAAQYAVVSFAIVTKSNTLLKPFPLWRVSSNDINTALLETQNHTKVQVKLLKTENAPEPPNSSAHLLVMSTMHDTFSNDTLLNLSDCPIGFVLDATQGSCVCSKILPTLSNCHISSEANSALAVIERPGTEWLGLMQLTTGTTVIGAVNTCTFYCRKRENLTVLVVNSRSVAVANPSNPNVSFPLCLEHREGPMCSVCSKGYSVVFGSNECKKCSNWWILTLLVYVVLGPVFIYLFYALKLTLTVGTLNGIIFCDQMIRAIDFPSSEYNYLNTLTRFFFGFELSFPHCFYNGMTEAWKSGIYALYPIYLISILLTLIVLCRFSVRLSNKISGSSIQVLVTVVHLSFSKLLLSILDVFTSVNIHTNTSVVHHVWLRDATVKYGQGSHLVLMIATLLLSVPILVVYMALLIAGRPLMRISVRLREYIRPMYEAIHAPYKRNKELFFVSRLLMVMLVYSLYMAFRGHDLLLGIAIASPILTTYTALEGLCRPFKRMSLNVFNFVLLSIASLIYGTGWYFLVMERKQGLVFIYAIFNAAITVSFIGVIILHFLWVTGLLDKIKRWKFWSHRPRRLQREVPHVSLSGSFFEPCDRVREPLLSSYHTQYS